MDNGAAFRSKHLEYITASLGIVLIHSKPYTPQGRGKIERWFKTVRTRFLADYTATTLAEFNAAFDTWLNEDYNQKKHGSTGQTPFDRFTSQMHCLRTSPANLKDYFRNVARRKVNKDRTITLNGRLYEGPVALIGKRIELLIADPNPETMFNLLEFLLILRRYFLYDRKLLSKLSRCGWEALKCFFKTITRD